MKLFLVDGIGPFFRDYDRKRINWSKIPFDNLEKNGVFDEAKFAGILNDFKRLADSVAPMGFNGITLDDLAHISLHPSYGESLKKKIRRYRKAYRCLFRIAAEHNLTVYMTTDVIFEPADQRKRGQKSIREVGILLRDMCADLFRDFPGVGGVIFRIGECDANDVKGDFASRLAIKTPGQARELIRFLLPVFEENNRLLIFRTWTVGAHPIGDLIWNKRTFDQTFGSFDSPNLVISMKYGETDFFRYLPLNKLFFHSNHKKIIEFQARREYEGFGEFPSFIGWDYENYINQLSGAPNLIGAWIWCQTGGWTCFRRRTFLDPGGIWNEINTAVTLNIVRDRMSTEQALCAWSGNRLGPGKSDILIVLLRLSDETIKQGLYIDEFARKKLFFRRLRVPPLISVFWDRIMINHSMRKLMRCFVHDHESKLAQSAAVLEKIKSMRALASALKLPTVDFDFQYDTFEIIQAARTYYFGIFGEAVVAHLNSLKAVYEERYPLHYTVDMEFKRFWIPRSHLRLAFSMFFRTQRGYRLVDRILFIRLLSLLSPLLPKGRSSGADDRLTDQAMGIATVLK